MGVGGKEEAMTHISDPDPPGLLLILATPSRVCLFVAMCTPLTSQRSHRNRTGPSER